MSSDLALNPAAQQAPVCVAALYQFARLPDYKQRRDALLALCQAQGVMGTLLLASEGVNGTIAGSHDGIAQVIAHIRSLPGCADLDVKLSGAQTMPFYRMKVRLKREIVTMGVEDIDPLSIVGTYVQPEDWNALIADPDTIVIDTRNDYEVAVGTFRGAIDPKTRSFREFPAWFRQERARLLGEATEHGQSGDQAGRAKAPKVAMFCTGGIRCEKSTAFLKQEGVEEVYHLKGGILNYLEKIPQEQSLWDGECFVFDQRVTIGHGLALGSYALCHACRRPISAEDAASDRYEEGVSCPACYDERSEAQRATYRERHRQEALAAARGYQHVGAKRFDEGENEQADQE